MEGLAVRNHYERVAEAHVLGGESDAGRRYELLFVAARAIEDLTMVTRRVLAKKHPDSQTRLGVLRRRLFDVNCGIVKPGGDFIERFSIRNLPPERCPRFVTCAFIRLNCEAITAIVLLEVQGPIVRCFGGLFPQSAAREFRSRTGATRRDREPSAGCTQEQLRLT